MNRAALAVAEHLNFDVPRPRQVFFKIDGVVVECGQRFSTRGRETCGHFGLGTDHLHAAAAAALSRLDHDRITDVIRQPDRVLIAANAAVGTGNRRDTELLGGALGGDLVAHQPDVFGARADEMHIVLAENFGKARVLRQKSVARMDGVGAGYLTRRKQRRNIQVAVLRGGRADADTLVGETHMHGVLVRGRMDGDRGDAEFLACAQHPQRDLAPIGDEDLVEHHSTIISGWPYSTGWPSSTSICTTVPERGAGIWFIVFIASMMMTGSPA